MRVVGGELRSRRLVRPPDGVRPTPDRVREAVFSKLGDVGDARVLDLFAGTGALAIEALSRGAKEAVLVDRSAASLGVIRRNLGTLDLEDRSSVVQGDAVRAAKRLAGKEPFDLVFLDPPYDRPDLLVECLEALVEHGLLSARAMVVVEGPKRHALSPPGGLTLLAERSYGETRIGWLSPAEPANE